MADLSVASCHSFVAGRIVNVTEFEMTVGLPNSLKPTFDTRLEMTVSRYWPDALNRTHSLRSAWIVAGVVERPLKPVSPPAMKPLYARNYSWSGSSEPLLGLTTN